MHKYKKDYPMIKRIKIIISIMNMKKNVHLKKVFFFYYFMFSSIIIRLILKDNVFVDILSDLFEFGWRLKASFVTKKLMVLSHFGIVCIIY